LQIRSIQNSNFSEAQKQTAIMQYKEKLANQQKMAMADAAITQSSSMVSPKSQPMTANMLPPAIQHVPVGNNPLASAPVPGGQQNMPQNALQYQQMMIEQQKRGQANMMMGRMPPQPMQSGMMGMSPRMQQQPGPRSPAAPSPSVVGGPNGSRNTPHMSSQVLPSPSIVASNNAQGGNMQGTQLVNTSGNSDMNNVADQIKASQMDLEKRIAMTHATMNAGLTGSAGSPANSTAPKMPANHMMARAQMMAGYAGMNHPATMGMMNGMMPGMGAMPPGIPTNPGLRGAVPPTTTAQLMQQQQQQQQLYHMGMNQVRRNFISSSGGRVLEDTMEANHHLFLTCFIRSWEVMHR
jgi:hypothetical protein